MFFGNELEIYKNDLEKADAIKGIMKAKATGSTCDELEYNTLRNYFIQNHKNIVPSIVRVNRDLNQFWDFISSKYGTYKERRVFIDNEFSEFSNALEMYNVTPHSDDIVCTLDSLDSEHISYEWKKALDRKIDDPDGAITMSRTILESTIKYILEDLEVEYSNKDDLSVLYKKVSKELDLYPQKYEDDIFKSILGSCANVVDKLGSLRNGISDAHGKGRVVYKPLPRHSELAVNLAGTMALFLLETHNKDRI